MNLHIASLLLVTAIWGSTFPVLKVATASLSGVEVSALRFLVAAICMAPWALRASRRAWIDGALLGLIALVSYVAQAYGLQTISSNRSAFLTSLNVLMVPFFGLALGNPISPRVVVAAFMACAGVGLMSWEGEFSYLADAATVVGAAAYAMYVIGVSALAPKHAAKHLAATQIVCMALMGLALAPLMAIQEHPQTTLAARLNTEVVLSLVYLGAIATAGVLFLQALAQRHVSADKAAVVYAMEPVFAALFAWWWIGESLSPSAAVGGLVIVAAVLLSEWRSPAGKDQEALKAT